MKYFFIMAFFSIAIVSVSLAQTPNWGAYSSVRSDYYFLDQQSNYDEISCRVDVPIINNMVDQLTSQLEPIKNKVSVEKDIESFTLTFNRSSRLQFKNPTFHVTATSMEGIPDPKRFTSGIDMVNRGFNDTVEGTKMQLVGIFDDYLSPKEEDYKDLSLVNQASGATTFTYIDTRTGSNKTEVFNGNRIEIIETSNQTNIKANQNYEKTASGKLILRTASAYMTYPSATIEMKVSVDYQQVEEIIFPRRFEVDLDQTVQTLESKGQWIVNLIDCVKK